jgi:hypothetical protein
MKYLISVLSILLAFEAGSQNLTSANPARLQVFLQTTTGDRIMLSCEELNNQFSQLTMTGSLEFSDLRTDNAEIQSLLDSLAGGRITYSCIIPEGQFVFHNSVNYTFSAEAEIIHRDHSGRFMMNFEVSNQKTSTANTFAITCSGKLSLSEHLGLVAEGEVLDEVSFQFFQNVRSLNY